MTTGEPAAVHSCDRLRLDVNVLSHKLGALVIANDGFLSAINTHLKPVEGSRMPMLASQVLNNIVKSADRSTIVKVDCAKR